MTPQFAEKLKQFRDFKKLGSELFNGGCDTYDDPWGAYVPYDYHWEVKRFFNSLTHEDKENLRNEDFSFYRKLDQFHEDILAGRPTEYVPEEEEGIEDWFDYEKEI